MPRPQGGAIRDLATDGSIVYGAGAGGAVVVSRDDGQTWSSTASPTTEDLHGIDAASGLVVAVGARGTIVRSKQGGAFEALIAAKINILESTSSDHCPESRLLGQWS